MKIENYTRGGEPIADLSQVTIHMDDFPAITQAATEMERP